MAKSATKGQAIVLPLLIPLLILVAFAIPTDEDRIDELYERLEEAEDPGARKTIEAEIAVLEGNIRERIAQKRTEREAAQRRQEAEAASREAEAERREQCRDEAEALVMAEDFVKRQLKAPATADFPWFDYQARSPECGKYVVRSYVDSQNGFGAMLRTHFTVTVRHVGGGRWKVEDFAHW